MKNIIVTELENKIKSASQKYYTDGTSPLSDEEFDALVDKLRQLNPNSHILKQTGWGYSVSADSTPGAKIPHKYQEAGSLSKAYTWKEIRADLKHVPVEVSLKLDGLSMVLYYESGHLVKALTRGDGTTGIDVTDKMLHVVPADIPDNRFTGAVRGEILMTRNNWGTYKTIHPEAKNSRNTTAGLINANGVSDELNLLNFVVYTVMGVENESVYEDSWYTDLHTIRFWLSQNFKDVVPLMYFSMLSKDADFDQIHFELRHSILLDKYPSDGLVIKAVNTTFNPITHGVYYIAQAYKFQAEVAITKVEAIEWNLTKTRYLMPKARLQTVELSGTNVSYATCFNASWVKDNKLGAGAVVQVQKHGEIIPVIDAVLIPGKDELPTRCPECGSLLEWSGVHLQCVNENCSNAAQQDLRVWLANLAQVDGFGDILKLKFLKQCLSGENLSIESVMNAGYDNLVYTTGGGSQYNMFVEMCDKLFHSTVPLNVAIRALNIPRLGDKTADRLAEFPKLILDILNAATRRPSNPDVTPYAYKLLVADRIGDANANALFDNLNKFCRLTFIRDRILWEYTTPVVSRSSSVAITGKLSVPRAKFEAELNAAGYTVGELSKSTCFLITDNPDSGSSKNKKADQLNIPKITEEEFRKRYMKV